jgi:hypothetical protein
MKPAVTSTSSQQQQLSNGNNTSPIMVAPEEFQMPRLGGGGGEHSTTPGGGSSAALHSAPPPLVSSSAGPSAKALLHPNSAPMATVATMNHMDDYDNCLRRDTESLFGPIDESLRGASSSGMQHPKIRVPPLRFFGGGSGAGAGATSQSGPATLGGVIKINHGGANTGGQAPTTTTTPVMGSIVAGGSFTFGTASVQRAGDGAVSHGVNGNSAAVGGTPAARFLPLSTGAQSPHFGRNIYALHVGSSSANSASNSAVGGGGSGGGGGASGTSAPSAHVLPQSVSMSTSERHHHPSYYTSVPSPSSLTTYPAGFAGAGSFTQPHSVGMQPPQQHAKQGAAHLPTHTTLQQQQGVLNSSNSGASPPLGMPPLPPPSPGAAAGAATIHFPFSMDELADQDQVMTQMAITVARHSGLREPTTVAECQELLETFMKEMQRPPSGVPQVVGGGNPSPRALGSSSAVDGRSTIVAELQWADGRDAPVPPYVGHTGGGSAVGENSWPHRSAQPIDLAIVNGALTPSSGHLTRNSGAPGSSNTTPRTSSAVLRGSPATHALLAGVSPRGALPLHNSVSGHMTAPYSYHRHQDPSGATTSSLLLRSEDGGVADSQPKPRRSAPRIHPAAGRSLSAVVGSSGNTNLNLSCPAVGTPESVDAAAVVAAAASYATIAAGATQRSTVGSQASRASGHAYHGHVQATNSAVLQQQHHPHQHLSGSGGFAVSLGNPTTGNMSVGNVTVSTSSNGSVGIVPASSSRPGAVRPGGVPEAIPSRGKRVERSASSAFSECSTSSTAELLPSGTEDPSSTHLAPPQASASSSARKKQSHRM